MLTESQKQEAIAWAEAMLHEAESSDNIVLGGTAYHLLGVTHQESGDSGRALPYLLQALIERRESQDRHGTAETLYHLGLVYSELGDYTQAIEAMEKSLTLHEENGNTDGVVSSLTELGRFYVHQGDAETALQYYGRGLHLATGIADPVVQANLLNHIGDVHFIVQDFAKAHTFFTEALALQPQVTTRLGNCLHESDAWDDALLAYQEAIRLAEQTGNAALLAEAKLALARLYNEKDYPGYSAKDAATLLREILTTEVSLSLSCRVHQELAEALKAQGDFAAAFSHLEAFHSLDKALVDQANIRRVASLQVLQEVALAQKDAELEHLQQVELARANAEVKRLSRQDELTGLLSRYALEERLTDCFATSLRYDTPFSVIFLDMDDFSTVNKTFGRAIGDEVLRVISRLLWSRCRETDAIGRYGGEEFCLLLPHTDASGAQALGEELRVTIETYDWDRIHAGLKITASFGISVHTTQLDGEGMMEEAERHLHQAKEEGRNRVVG